MQGAAAHPRTGAARHRARGGGLSLPSAVLGGIDEVRHTFWGAMPFNLYTLCSGFVSTLLVENFTFYNNSELTSFTSSQFEDILLALCMGLHTLHIQIIDKCIPLLHMFYHVHHRSFNTMCPCFTAHINCVVLSKQSP